MGRERSGRRAGQRPAKPPGGGGQERPREGAAPSLSALAQELDDKLMSTLSQMLARNHDVSPSPADLEMYMDRMEQSVPKSSQAGKMSNDEIENYLTSILNKKQKKN